MLFEGKEPLVSVLDGEWPTWMHRAVPKLDFAHLCNFQQHPRSHLTPYSIVFHLAAVFTPCSRSENPLHTLTEYFFLKEHNFPKIQMNSPSEINSADLKVVLDEFYMFVYKFLVN